MDNLIPADAVSLVEAYRQTFTAVTPDWEALETQAEDEAIVALADSDSTPLEFQTGDAGLNLAVARDNAESIILAALSDGSLTAYVRDDNGGRLRVPTEAWSELTVLLGRGITAGGAGRPRFFLRAEFDAWLRPIRYSAARTGKKGRPNLVRLVEPQFKRACEAGKLEHSWQEQASKLIAWFRQAYPTLDAPTEKTLRLAFAKDYKKAKDAGKSLK